ncbi:MAG: non-canonical purine NTP pyrophosphatase [Planctomycetota bacterium]|nr:MAG: non-canonical purine NTP pyrophosphatase [Planctomycetota bacterium]
MSRLLVATTNAGKLSELRGLLAPLGFELLGLAEVDAIPEAPENGATFAENARSKALHYARASGLDTLADDSGLEVSALQGAPGVRSARFAGEHAQDSDNNRLLLERLRGETDRRARFVCALCLVENGRPSLEADGVCQGTLLEQARGDGGFGYDPLFVPDDAPPPARSFAELTREEKQSLSHRGRALAVLRATLSARGANAP